MWQRRRREGRHRGTSEASEASLVVKARYLIVACSHSHNHWAIRNHDTKMALLVRIGRGVVNETYKASAAGY